jgi:hypothetical protein
VNETGRPFIINGGISIFIREGPVAFPFKVCSICGEEFELRPGKPGFANHCPACSEQENAGGAMKNGTVSQGPDKELSQARREAMRNLLYRKDS